MLLEVNQPWDWNQYWTTNRYPDSYAYKHSAQPSIIYAVTVKPENSVLYFNPIGHGDPKGETGNLYTNLSTLTTGKEILQTIKVKVKKK